MRIVKQTVKWTLFAYYAIQIRNIQRYINPDGAVVLRNEPLT